MAFGSFLMLLYRYSTCLKGSVMKPFNKILYVYIKHHLSRVEVITLPSNSMCASTLAYFAVG